MAETIVRENHSTCPPANRPLPSLGVWQDPPEDNYSLLHTKSMEDLLFYASKLVLEGDTQKAHEILIGLVEVNRSYGQPKEYWLDPVSVECA